MNTHLETGLVFLILLCRCNKVSAVNKACADAGTVCLVSPLLAEDHGRIVMMARRAADAADLDFCALHRNPLCRALHRMTAGEIDHLIIFIHQIHAERQHFFQLDCRLSVVFQSCRSRNHVFVFKYSVEQFQYNTGSFLFHRDDKRFSFFFLCIVQCRHTRNRIGMIEDFIRIETEICRTASIHLTNPNHIITVIADSARRYFLRQCIQRIRAIASGFLRISCKSHIRTENQTGKIFLTDFFSIVEMQKHIFVICEHLVTAVFCLEGK